MRGVLQCHDSIPREPAKQHSILLRSLTVVELLQPWIDRFTLQGQYAEDAFVDSAKGFVADEAFQALDTEGEFTEGEGALGSETSVSQPGEMPFGGVVGAVDDSQVFPTSAFHGGLNQAILATHDEVQRFDNHPFAAPSGQGCPPLDASLLAVRIGHVDYVRLSGPEELRIVLADLGQLCHVPQMILVRVNLGQSKVSGTNGTVAALTPVSLLCL